MSHPTPLASAEPVAHGPVPVHPSANGHVSPPRHHRVLQGILAGVLCVAVFCVFLVFVLGVQLPGLAFAHEEKTVAAPPPLAVELVPGVPHTLRVPEDVRVALGIRKGKVERVEQATLPTTKRILEVPGSTALDPSKVVRMRIGFTPAKVVEVGTRPDKSLNKEGRTEFRELRSGDWVKKGEMLAILYSVDVGSKKNDLIDGLVQLKLDEQILARAEKASYAVPEAFLLNARRNVEADRNAIGRALNTLKTWNIPKGDIDAVYQEAEAISKRKGKRDTGKESVWPRVVLRAPEAGFIVERNLALHETIVDNTLNLFQLAQVERLTVVAYAPEDELTNLTNLLKLPAERHVWTLRTMNASAGDGIVGRIDDVSYLVDVNQHSAVVKGHVDNPKGKLRSGQFITATIELDPPDGVVQVPATAVVDDGRQSVVFVQPDATKQEYTMRRVEVTHRFDKVVYVRSMPLAKGKARSREEKEQGLLPRMPLRAEERVLTTGVLELKRELEDRESKAAEQH